MEGGLIFCSLSHRFHSAEHYPLRGSIDGYTERRHYIIENDYDSEFIYTGAQVNSLYQLAPERVIHVGTFSKTLAPFLRLGYMVVPGELVPRVKELQSRLYRRVNTHVQMAFNYLFEQGIYIKHVTAMCKRYKERCSA